MMRNIGKHLRMMAAAIAGMFRRGPRHYADPILKDEHHRPRSRVGTKRRSRKQGPPRYGRPPCTPGTITYHDKLVRHFGRREADRIGRLIQKGEMADLPFVSNPATAGEIRP